MLPALTPRDHSTVPARQHTVVMATIVQVSVLFSAFLPVNFSFVIDPNFFFTSFIQKKKDSGVQEGFGGIAITVEVICNFGHEVSFNEVTQNTTHHFFNSSLGPRHSYC